METLFNINSTWMTRIVCHQHAIDNSASSLLFEVVQFKKLVCLLLGRYLVLVGWIIECFPIQTKSTCN